MDRLSFLSCFDVNRSTFDEDKLEQDFYIFVPSGLDLSPLELNILSRIVTLVQFYVSTKLEVSPASPFPENRRHGMDGRTWSTLNI